MVRSTDGFVIAEEDFRLRGGGTIAGTEQSGRGEFQFGDLVKDRDLLEKARKLAIEVVTKNPSLEGAEWLGVKSRIAERRSTIALITIS
jgi:ATP-dependent DNA helicase RecG